MRAEAVIRGPHSLMTTLHLLHAGAALKSYTEAIGARILSPLFGPKVAQPVALHVTAKRWRCTREPSYYEDLSPTSKATLKAQGGLLSEEECQRFEAHPGFKDALRLRTWDDLGKDEEQTQPQLGEFRELLRRLAKDSR